MNTYLILALFIAATFAQYVYVDVNGSPAEVNDVVFVKSWNDQSKAGWYDQPNTPGSLASATFVDGYAKGRKALKISSTNASTSKLITTSIADPVFNNLNFVRGTTIRLTALFNASVTKSASPVGGVAIRLAAYWGSSCSNSAAPQQVVYGNITWANSGVATVTYTVPQDICNLNVSLGLISTTGYVLFDNVQVTVITSVPVIPANLLWNLTTSCESFGPGVIYPVISCSTTNVPTGYVLPNSFQILIGPNGPYNTNNQEPASLCEVSYLASAPSTQVAYCNAYTDGASGPKTYSIYVRNYITQQWVLTKSTVSTCWNSPNC